MRVVLLPRRLGVFFAAVGFDVFSMALFLSGFFFAAVFLAVVFLVVVFGGTTTAFLGVGLKVFGLFCDDDQHRLPCEGGTISDRQDPTAKPE